MHQNWGTADDGGEECRWSAHATTRQQNQTCSRAKHANYTHAKLCTRTPTTRTQNCAHARCAAEMQIEHAALCLQTRYATRASSSNRRQRAIKFWIWKRKTCVLRTKAGCLRQQQHYPRGRCTVDPDGPTTADAAVTWERQIKSVCGPKLSASRCSSVRGEMCGRPTLTSPPLPIPPTYLVCRMPMSIATRANLIDKREITTLRQPAAAAAAAATTTSDEQQKAAAAEKEQLHRLLHHVEQQQQQQQQQQRFLAAQWSKQHHKCY